MTSRYEQLVRRLYEVNKFTAAKLGLENTRRLDRVLGSPSTQFPSIHVAGTNGKGSVSGKIAKALEAAELRTGLFVSPHISSFRERIQISSALICEERVADILSEVFDATERHQIPATFFEITTVAAFKYFAEEKADVVVLETGLGGRLDATNIVSPLLSVITSIGLDHTKILGGTIEDIAREKAGIIKPKVPVIVGPSCPHEVIKPIAESLGAKYILVESATSRGPVDYDVENSQIAEKALRQLQRRFSIPESAIASGIGSRPPCRFEKLQATTGETEEVDVILDVAHNPPAIQRLLQKLTDSFPGRGVTMVLGFSADKDIDSCLKAILTCKDVKNVVFATASHPRSATMEELQRRVAMFPEAKSLNLQFGITRDGRVHSSVTSVVKAALQACTSSGDVLVVCGSIFLMSEARQTLGVEEPRAAGIPLYASRSTMMVVKILTLFSPNTY